MTLPCWNDCTRRLLSRASALIKRRLKSGASVPTVADVGGPENIDPRIRVRTGLRSRKPTALPNRLRVRIVILHRIRVSDEISFRVSAIKTG